MDHPVARTTRLPAAAVPAAAVPVALGAVLGSAAALPVAVDGASTPVSVGMALVVAGQCAALGWSAARPVPVMGATWLGAVALAAVVPYAGSLGAANVAVGALARWAPPRVSAVGLAAMLALAPWNVLVGGVAQVLLAALVGVLAWTAGALVRVDAERRADHLARVVAEERAAIVRDVHDVLAHGLSVVSVHTNAALDAFDIRPEVARRSLETIDTTTRGALADLRRVLAAAGPGACGPAGGLGGLDALADTVRAGGLTVTVHRCGGPLGGEDGTWLGATVYRIVQEALTNVVRHARAGRVEVRVAVEPDRVHVLVEDDGAGSARSGDGAGRGLIGMAERAAALGGTLTAGAGPAGGFRVEAVLPRAGSR